MSSRPVGRWLFGKMPVLGDFLSRGLDFALRDGLDHWLSAGMEAARARFPDFDDRYVAAPAWCFVDQDPAGLWSGGALCASVDAAGRRFPLMLATPAEDAGQASALAGGCLNTLYAALGEGWDADRLHGAAIDPVALPWHPAAPTWAMIAQDGTAVVAPGRFPPDIVPRMLEMAA